MISYQNPVSRKHAKFGEVFFSAGVMGERGGIWRQYSAKPLAEECTQLRIADYRKQVLRQKGRLPTDSSAIGEISVQTWKGLQLIQLVGTPQRLGGARWWYTCPQCPRRCAVLYRPAVAPFFACRKCSGVRYKSQKLSPRLRAAMRLTAIRAKLGLLEGEEPKKPKRMRGATFERLVKELKRLEGAARAPTRIQQLRRSGYTHREARTAAFGERMDRRRDAEREGAAAAASVNVSAPLVFRPLPCIGSVTSGF